jgi:hypothetical protein
MSATIPTARSLMDRLVDDLRKRNVELDPDAQKAIEDEFKARHQRSNYADDVLKIWDENLYRYVDLLDQIARDLRKQRGLQPDASVVLIEPLVRKSFAICSRICPGPT